MLKAQNTHAQSSTFAIKKLSRTSPYAYTARKSFFLLKTQSTSSAARLRPLLSPTKKGLRFQRNPRSGSSLVSSSMSSRVKSEAEASCFSSFTKADIVYQIDSQLNIYIFYMLKKLAQRIQRISHSALSRQHCLLIGPADPMLPLLQERLSGWKVVQFGELQGGEECVNRIKEISRYFEAVVVINRWHQPPKTSVLQAYQALYPFLKTNLIAAQIASRLLAPTGTFLLEIPKVAFSEEVSQKASYILANQLSYLNVVLGQREQVNVNAHVVGCLVGDEEGKELAQIYGRLCEGRKMPYPGSFLRFEKGSKGIYPQYM